MVVFTIEMGDAGEARDTIKATEYATGNHVPPLAVLSRVLSARLIPCHSVAHVIDTVSAPIVHSSRLLHKQTYNCRAS